MERGWGRVMYAWMDGEALVTEPGTEPSTQALPSHLSSHRPTVGRVKARFLQKEQIPVGISTLVFLWAASPRSNVVAVERVPNLEFR